MPSKVLKQTDRFSLARGGGWGAPHSSLLPALPQHLAAVEAETT